MAKDRLVPFDSDGNMLAWADGVEGEDTHSVKWMRNDPFTDTLTYAGYSRGQSSVNVIFVNGKGQKFSMFMSDLDYAIKHMTHGVIYEGLFRIVKKGQNYGVQLQKD